MDRNTLDADFQAYRERGDLDALAAVFDAAAPRLLLIAAHLTSRADDAEDLVQATFLAALRQASEFRGERPVLAWLAGILRHRALDLGRRRAVRAEHSLADVDEAHEPVAPQRSPIEFAEDSEAFERVVAAIASLEAPYRELLTLRLVHGLDPAAIAHARGANPSTVRVQLKRGLERLRAALPDATTLLGAGLAAVIVGEGTRGLAAVKDIVLAGVRPPPTAVASTSTAAAGVAWSSWGAVAAVAIVLAALFALLRPEPTAEPTLARATSGAEALVDASAETPTTDVAELEVLGYLTPREPAASADQPVQSNDAKTVTVRGRLLLPDGSPAAGVGIEVSGDFSLPDHVRALEPPQRWKGTKTATDANGDFASTFESELAGNLRVRSEAEDLPSANWELRSVEPGAVIDLGTCTLPPSAAMRGHIRQPDGSSASGIWNVYVTTHWSPSNGGASVVDTRTEVDASLGEFVITGIPFGPFQVSAIPVNTPGGWLPFASGVHSADAPGAFELRTNGVDQARRTTLHLVRKLVSSFAEVDGERIRLLAPNGSVAVPTSWHARSNMLFLDGLPDGEYTLSLDDTRHVIGDSPTIRAGTPTIVALRGSVEVELTVVDRDSRASIDGWFAHVHDASRDRIRKWSGNWLSSKPQGMDGATHFATVPDAQVWTIEAEGYKRLDYSLPEGFEPHSHQRIEIELTRSPTISGRVRNVDGSPAADALVVARASEPHPLAEAPGDSSADRDARESWIAWCRTRTDASGAFVLHLAEDVPHDVMLVLPRGQAPSARGVAPGTVDVELRLTPKGRIEGSLAGDSDLTRWTIESWNSATPTSEHERLVSRLRGDGLIAIDASGRFAIEDLEPGHYVVRVSPPQREVVGTMGTSFVPVTGPTRELAVDVVAGQTTHVDFDVSDPTLGSIVVRVLDGDVPAVGLNVVALGPGFAPGVEQVVDASLTNDEGVARLVRLSPGAWRVATCPVDGTWRVEASTLVTVESGSSAEVDIAIALATRRVRFLDDEGRVLGGRRIALKGLYSGSQHFETGSTVWTTNGDGELTLTLDVGTYALELVSEGSTTADASAPHSGVLDFVKGDAEPIDVVMRQP